MSLLLLFAGAKTGQVPVPPAPPAPKAGWFKEFDKPRRRIPLELLREVLKEQGNPWADELEDAVVEVKKTVRATKSKKLKKTLEEAFPILEERLSDYREWTYVIDMMNWAAQASRTTQQIKYAELLLDFLKGEEEEEELVLLTYSSSE